MLLLSMGYVFAEQNSIPFEYNVLPTIQNGSAIDTNVCHTLSFHLYEHIDNIYYNDSPVEVINDEFAIDVSNLSGKVNLVFRNSANQTASFQYFFADKDGLLADYSLLDNQKLNVYIKTHHNIKILYTDREEKAFRKLIQYIDLLPETVTQTVDTIKMIPFDNAHNIAGITQENTITLYKFSQYILFEVRYST